MSIPRESRTGASGFPSTIEYTSSKYTSPSLGNDPAYELGRVLQDNPGLTMKDSDWRRIGEEKDAVRQRNAEKPFSEKLAQLDRLRERSAAIRVGRDTAPGRSESSTRGTETARRKK